MLACFSTGSVSAQYIFSDRKWAGCVSLWPGVVNPQIRCDVRGNVSTRTYFRRKCWYKNASFQDNSSPMEMRVSTEPTRIKAVDWRDLNPALRRRIYSSPDIAHIMLGSVGEPLLFFSRTHSSSTNKSACRVYFFFLREEKAGHLRWVKNSSFP